MTAVLVAAGAFVAMEAVSYLMHRFVMHRIGWSVHADHHRPNRSGWERNDLFPTSFSTLAIALFFVGTSRPGFGLLVAAGIGMTAYGMAYVYVHEVCIHQRLHVDVPVGRYGEWLRRMHRIHHLYGGEPYGMLLPIVPGALRHRAALDEREPLPRAASTRARRNRL